MLVMQFMFPLIGKRRAFFVGGYPWQIFFCIMALKYVV